MRINISETRLRSLIRSEIKRRRLLEQANDEDTSDYTGNEEAAEDAGDAEGTDDPSNAELTKAMKANAADMASEVPTALNAEYADLIKSLTDLAGGNKSMFLKVASLVDRTAGDEIDAAQAKG